MNSGFIKLHRKFLKWEWYSDYPTFKLFIHFLLMANHKEESWRGLLVKRGQHVTSYSKLSKKTGLSVRQVRTAISNLKTTGELTYQTTSKYGLVTIINYDTYQSYDTRNAYKTSPERQTNDSQTTTNNNDNNINNEKNIKGLALSGVNLTPEEIQKIAMERQR